MKIKLVRRIAALAAATIVFTGGLTGVAQAATRTLTVGGPSDPAPSFYDGVHYSDGQALFFEALYDQLLVRTAPASAMGVAPGLAESYTVSSDKTTVTLQIRKGVEFTDGSTLTPETVKANLDRRNDTSLPSYSRFDKGGTQEITSVTVSGSKVIVKFAKAQPNAAYYFSGPSGFILSAAAAKDPNLTKSGVYGSGPYKLDVAKSIKGNIYRLVKNRYHWNAKNYPYDVINYKVYATQQALANASAAGQLDVALEPAGTVVGLLKSRNVGLLSKGGNVYMNLWWDKLGKNAEFTKDKNVRLAFMYGTDRAALVKGVFAGDRPSSSLAGKTAIGYSSYLDKTYTYNPTKAKEMLAAAGYPNITFNQNVSPNDAAYWQALKTQWAKIGVTVNLDINSDTAKSFASVRTGVMGVFSFDTSNLVAFGGLLLNSFPNFQGATSPVIGAALGALAADPTSSTKAEALNRAIVEEGWVTPIREGYSYTAYKKATVKPLTIGANGNVWPLLREIKPAK